MIGAKVVFQSLVKHGVKYVFGYPGGAILPVLNEFYNQSKLKYILSRTELGGSFMAEGYAKATKQPGVIMVTSGPGAINIMTSMQNALSDGTPIVALTGQVSTTVIGTDAFQEADIVGISKPCTKWNCLLTDSSKIDANVDKAFHLATDKRHGPVLLDLPKNIMSSVAAAQTPYVSSTRSTSLSDSTVSYNRIHEYLVSARRPVVLAGQGILQADCVTLFRRFVESYNLPVTTTLLGLGIVPSGHRLSLRMLGMHGSYAANKAIQECDLLLNFGSRFDDRIIGLPSAFSPRSTIIHFDLLQKNINKTIPTSLYRVEDCQTGLEGLLEYPVPAKRGYLLADWWRQIDHWKQTGFRYPATRYLQGRHVLDTLNTLLQGDKQHSYTIVADVGAHQMWAAQFIDYDSPRIKFVTSGGLGSMGFALPASIGVKLGSDDRVICVCGDGGFQMTFQELSTAIEYGIGIKVIILNNNCQLMVKIWQEKFYANQVFATNMKNPPFELVCRALGCEAWKIDSAEGLSERLQAFLEFEGPIVLNVGTDSSESVLPMVSPGKALDDMILEETGEAMKGDAPC